MDWRNCCRAIWCYKCCKKIVITHKRIQENSLTASDRKIEESKIRPSSIEYFKQRVAAIVGTPEQLVADLHRYIDIGITHFIMDFIGLDEESLPI